MKVRLKERAMVWRRALLHYHDQPMPPRHRYRLSISYISKEWSLDSSGWGDTECKEYLRLTRLKLLHW